MNLEMKILYEEMNLVMTFEKGNESVNDISKPRYEPGDDI